MSHDRVEPRIPIGFLFCSFIFKCRVLLFVRGSWSAPMQWSSSIILPFFLLFLQAFVFVLSTSSFFFYPSSFSCTVSAITVAFFFSLSSPVCAAAGLLPLHHTF